MNRAVVALTFALLSVAATAYALTPGQRAPEIGLTDLGGHRVDLAGLRGQVVIVDFWGSWCTPCAQEMPVLERLYTTLHAQGLTVVGVAQDHSATTMQSFLRRVPVSFPIVHDVGQSVAHRYNPATMPGTFIVDRRGIVRHVHAGYVASDAAIIEAEVRALL